MRAQISFVTKNQYRSRTAVLCAFYILAVIGHASKKVVTKL